MKDPYLYPDSEVLKNLAGIHDTEELKNMEADYTLLRLSEIAEGDSLERFNFQTLCGLHYRIFQDALERGQEMKGHVAKMIRESGLADTEERIRQIILWNRKEKRDHLPEEIKEKIIHWEKEK